MGEQQQAGRKASFGATMKAVCWSFLGIRKRSDYEHDSANLKSISEFYRDSAGRRDCPGL